MINVITLPSVIVNSKTNSYYFNIIIPNAELSIEPHLHNPQVKSTFLQHCVLQKGILQIVKVFLIKVGDTSETQQSKFFLIISKFRNKTLRNTTCQDFSSTFPPCTCFRSFIQHEPLLERACCTV